MRYAPPSNTIDPDVQAYITAESITDPTEIAATNTFILGLKANSFYTRFVRLFLHSPTSQAASLADFISAGANTMTAVNSPTWNSNGFTFDGATNYCRLNLVMNTVLSNSNWAFHAYIRSMTNTSARRIIGSNQNLNSIQNDLRMLGGSSMQFTPGNNLAGVPAAGVITGNKGFVTGTTGSSTDTRILQNGVVIDTQTLDTGRVRNSVGLYYGANNNNGTANSFGVSNVCFVGISSNFSTAETLTLYGLVQDFQTNVIAGGRQV